MSDLSLFKTRFHIAQGPIIFLCQSIWIYSNEVPFYPPISTHPFLWSFSLFTYIHYLSPIDTQPLRGCGILQFPVSARLGEYKWPNGRSFSPSAADIWRGNLWVCRLRQFKLWTFFDPLLKWMKWTKTDLSWFTRRFKRLCLSGGTNKVSFNWGESLHLQLYAISICRQNDGRSKTLQLTAFRTVWSSFIFWVRAYVVIMPR